MAKDRALPSRWLDALPDLIEHADDASLPRRLVSALAALTPIDCSLVLAFRRDDRPLVLFDDTARGWRDNAISEYLTAAYLLDPFHLAAREGLAPGVYRLDELAPDGFAESEYYRVYYQRGHVEEEICHLAPVDDRVTIAVSLERARGSRRFSAAELARQRRAEPTVRALLRAHWRSIARARDGAASAVGASIQRAHESFGSSVLTPRECEVVRLLLGGHSTRSLAARLGISAGTAKVHRERIYAKLDVSLQSELFHLFIDSVSSLPEGAEGDPLAHYLRRPSRAAVLSGR